MSLGSAAEGRPASHRRCEEPEIRSPTLLTLALLAALLMMACSGGDGDGDRPSAATASADATGSASVASPGGSGRRSPSAPTGEPGARPVRVQLAWVHQAQFAGYLAAIEQGYYEAAGLAVTLIEGGPDVMPHAVGSAPDGPEFTVAWVPSVLVARAAGDSDLVHIAQVVQRSGTLSISHKAAGITLAEHLRGRKVGVLSAGRGLEVLAGAAGAGLAPGEDFSLTTQGPNIGSFLSGKVDVAQATIYNEYALVLEAPNPATGQPYQPTDLNVINWNDEGSAMLQDAVFARASWLADDDNEAVARDFLEATFEGWMYCRDEPDACVQFTVDAGAAHPAGHQAWMMNEINGLIWPSPGGIGSLEPEAWQDTVTTLLSASMLAAPPGRDAYRTDLAEAALAGLEGLDTTGESFVKGDVSITPGGG